AKLRDRTTLFRLCRGGSGALGGWGPHFQNGRAFVGKTRLKGGLIPRGFPGPPRPPRPPPRPPPPPCPPRPPPPPPWPPRPPPYPPRPPPPPPRSACGRASFTTRFRPPKFCPFSEFTARSASSSLLISTKANPRDCPVKRSRIRFTADGATPPCEKKSCSWSSVAENGRFPT